MEGKPSLCETQVSNVLVFPFPIQGHINPMLQFSKRLASKGLRVTLLAITSTNKPMQLSESSINIEPIEFEEGENVAGVDDYLDLYTTIIPGKLAKLIEKKKSSQHPIKFLVYDSGSPWTLDVARSAGIDAAPFFTQSWAVNAIYYHFHKGTLKLPLEQPVVKLPSMPALEVSDLPSFVRDTEAYPGLGNLVRSQFTNLEEASLVFCNTLDMLEDEVIRWMSSYKPIKTIGPTLPSIYLDKRLEDDKDYGINLFKPDTDACIKWLDSKEPASVVYISFGSLAALGEEQMEEIALGLKRSNKFFLWVVRETEQKKLPTNFVEEALEKGLVVSWSPQLRVLAHKAVGCFITHCGWNSTLEALSLGVPMVAMPQWTDQPTNAKFVEDVWKVGIRVRVDKHGIIKKEEIERCVREVMEGEKSLDIKSNSESWKKLIKEAVDEGGSSDRNIDEFVAKIICK
ncbi:hypothetical protein SLEP1_g14631 [Rubroshorea leprosula]|uniref:Glycosyltransferase n=1 Tax=Rubroshorea leprosula TaxID=152421 RepID=A0AAV5IQK7_9ROSI|nr:hypothetical protein SLEP1_g14631 [Rubroshorea leprosula]